MLILLVTMNKFSTIFAVQNKCVGLLLFVIYWSIFLEFFLLLVLMAHIVQVYIDIYTTFKVEISLWKYIDKCGYNRCGEVVARLLSPMWRGYQSCGEVTQPSVARLPNLWRYYLWRGYLVARLQSGYSPIFRWNLQHFNYILVSVARFLPYFI